MSTAAERNADWMWKNMQEATDELLKRPAWEIEMLRNAPRMYPSIRPKEEEQTSSASKVTAPRARKK